MIFAQFVIIRPGTCAKIRLELFEYWKDLIHRYERHHFHVDGHVQQLTMNDRLDFASANDLTLSD